MMEENPRKTKSGGADLPVVMIWIGKPELCLTKEEAAKRRPRSNSSTPVVYERIEVSPRHFLKSRADDSRAKGHDANVQADG